MEIIIDSDLTDSPLVVATSTVTEDAVKDIKEFRSKGIAQSILGSLYEVWLGQPRFYDIHALTEQGVISVLSLPTDVRQVLFLSFACSFRSAPDCEFVGATVRGTSKKQWASDNPLVLDIFPREIYIPTIYKRTFKIAPSIKVEVEKVASAEVSLFESNKLTEYIKYEPQITGFGVGTNEFGWDFNRTHAIPIKGIKVLNSIIEIRAKT